MKMIFIGGCPRSGTTLLASLISNHSEIIAVPEAHFRIELMRKLENVKPENIFEKVKFLENDLSFGTWNIQLPGRETFKNKPHEVSNFAFVYNILINEFCSKYYPEKKDSYSCVVDHNPDNVKIAFQLKKHFHKSSFIHIIRDGRAVANSAIPLKWGPNNIYDAATFWLTNLSFGFQAVSYYGYEGHELFYENILTNPALHLREVIRKMDINFESTQISSGGLVLPEFTKNQHRLVNKPLNKAQISAWKKKLTPRQIYIFEKMSEDMLILLGYSKENLDVPFGNSNLIKIFIKSSSFSKNYLNKLLFKIKLRKK